MEIKPVDYTTLQQTIELAREFSVLEGSVKKFNDKKLDAILRLSFYQQNKVFAQVLVDDQQVVGFFIGFINEGAFYDDLHANELGWYVRPDKRGIASIKMLTNFIEWAEAKNVDAICLFSMKTLSNLDDLYLRYGFQEKEKSFVRFRNKEK